MKRPTWEELEEVVNEENCVEYLDATPKRYRKAMALALSIARWRPERREGRRGDGQNALCIYDSGLSDNDLNCPRCPLKNAGQWCPYPSAIFQKWRKFRNAPPTACNWGQRDAAADDMYNLLCKLYKREYLKC